MILKITKTNKFIKQYSKLFSQKNFKEENFVTVLKMLVNNELLPIKYHNHLLEPKSKRHMGMSFTTRYIIRIYED